VTRSLLRSNPAASPGAEGRDDTDALTRDAPGAAAHVRDAAARLLTDPPPDLAWVPRHDLGRNLVWLVRTVRGEPDSDDTENGAALVVRRRIIDAIRGDLVSGWIADPISAEDMLQVLHVLEHARDACAARPDQAFVAELADRGGLDLVVEVAHDMRSPLTSVLFLSEILHGGQSGPLTETQKRQVGIIYSAALGLVGMASDMIEAARGGNQLESGTPSPLSINEILASVEHLVAPTAEEKKLELRLVTLPSSHRLGYAIPLSRVLLNLTTNALKFTREGYVELSAQPVDGSTVEFAVRDTGPGISPDSVETLYQPFKRQPARETGYSFSGTGRGLSICQRLVTAMGSSLEVESDPDWGTRFSFRLNLPPAHLF
jgi:signal transduction histidine kinase